MHDLFDPAARPDAFPQYPLAELHAHLGSSIEASVLWKIAHDLGMKLPKRDYREFCEFITLSPSRSMALNDYFRDVYHPVLDKLSSGTHAVEKGVYNTMSGAYRNGIELIELRTNPMKHNINAEVDLDHLIMAMLHGMERALLEHKGLAAGLILCIAREWGYERNAKIIKKAIKYRRRGIVGIDIAGPATPSFRIADYQEIFASAREADLGITVHSGEAKDANDIMEVLEYLKPSRIGHGVLATRDPVVMERLVADDVVLEVCPMSNLATQTISGLDEMRQVLRTLVDHKVKFTINTDWPEVIEGGRLRSQYQLLRDKKLLSEAELVACTKNAFEASFVKKSGIEAYL